MNKNIKHIDLKYFVVIIDMLLVIIASYLSLALRFEMKYIPMEYTDIFVKTLLPNILIYLSVFWILQIYNTLWTYFSVEETFRMSAAVILAVIIEFLLFVFTPFVLPRSYYVIKTILLAILMFSVRIVIRVVKEKRAIEKDKTIGTNVMIIGAGSAGALLINELRNNRQIKYNIKCILDDNKEKRNRRLKGIEITGNTEEINKCVKKNEIDEIIIAMPSAGKDRISELVKEASTTGVKVKIFEGIYDKLKKNFMSSVREASYADLLERDPIKVDDKEIKNSIKDQIVLVTGGGGSIGSELSRQIMANKPKKLIILDIYENNAYQIQMELEGEYGHKNLDVVIASVREYERMEEIFKKYKPSIVFHAAAHKHVPLMENSPNEAIKNNCLGTFNLAKLADKYKVKNFVLISTDKAVRPTSLMGATKRICEMIIQAHSRKSKTKFVAVRFGNVLGSNGSVIPLFMKQIEHRRPCNCYT